MKAAIHTRYGLGEVVEIKEVAKPAPKDNEVLIKVRAASINPIDWHLMEGKPAILRLFLGLRRPKDPRIGRDVAGEVEAVGQKVTRFKIGDTVFGIGRGTFAEYACASELHLATKPQNVSFEQAASVPIAALTALQALRDKGRIQPGCKVLINGGAGGVGTFAVQVAKSFGADVTAVCSTRNVEMLQSLGADCVIDYTRQDFSNAGWKYDLIFDLIANRSLANFRRMLNPRGIYVAGGAGPGSSIMRILGRMLAMPAWSMFVSQKFVIVSTKASTRDLDVLRDFMEARTITPMVESSYKFAGVPEAFRYLATGHARAKLVIIPE